jgi:PPOX class probable F420-dependent enzyme
MELADALDWLRANHRSVLATRRRDGRPQMSPVVHAVSDDGRVLVSTRQGAMKVLNVRQDANVSLCCLGDGFFGRWVQVDGRAEVVVLPEAMSWLRFTYAQVAGEHPDWEEFERDMVSQQRVVLAITPERAGPDRAG